MEHLEEQALVYEISWLVSQNASLRVQLVQLQQQHHALIAASTQQHQMLATAGASHATAPSNPATDIWGPRLRGMPVPHLYDMVFSSQWPRPDYPACILDTLRPTLGLRALRLGGICRLWREAAAERRLAWRVLQCGRDIGCKLESPYGVAILPGGGVCVSEARPSGGGEIRHLQIFASPLDNATPRLMPSVQDCSNMVCDGEVLYITTSSSVEKRRLADETLLHRTASGFCNPRGLCVMDDTVYVCESGRHRIVALGLDLTWRYSFGSELGNVDGGLGRPMSVATHGGELYVADQDKHRLTVFALGDDDRMQFKRCLGSPGQFKRPWGVCILRGLLLVTQQGRKSVQVMTRNGVPLQVLYLTSHPVGICASLDGHVWVVGRRPGKMMLLECLSGPDV